MTYIKNIAAYEECETTDYNVKSLKKKKNREFLKFKIKRKYCLHKIEESSLILLEEPNYLYKRRAREKVKLAYINHYKKKKEFVTTKKIIAITLESLQ